MLTDVVAGTLIVPEEVWATYLVPLPIDIVEVTLQEYVPARTPVKEMLLAVDELVTPLNVTDQDVPAGRPDSLKVTVYVGITVRPRAEVTVMPPPVPITLNI